MMEGYILGGSNIAEHIFKNNFAKIYGRRVLMEFQDRFRDSFITEADIKRISSWGASCIRVPFNYRLIETRPYKYSKKGLNYLKKAVCWAKKYNMHVLLDLHAARGSQNKDWHSDSAGRALLWEEKEHRERTAMLWQYLADEFKDEEAVCGYDILNEPVIDRKKIPLLKAFYKRVIKKIREVDGAHAVFLEGNLWAQEIDFLEDLLEDKAWVSIHAYQPLDFTFNFRPYYKYPGYVEKIKWDKSRLKRSLEKYKRFCLKNSVDLLVGEFGINYRGGVYGELEWLKDIMDIFEEWDFSWTYWTYKAVAGYVFPDGIMQYLDNPGWVSREGLRKGWENFYHLWKSDREKITASWLTDNFVANKEILRLLEESYND